MSAISSILLDASVTLNDLYRHEGIKKRLNLLAGVIHNYYFLSYG